jgi:hypothetical protein
MQIAVEAIIVNPFEACDEYQKVNEKYNKSILI